jgi:hypothetical protein
MKVTLSLYDLKDWDLIDDGDPIVLIKFKSPNGWLEDTYLPGQRKDLHALFSALAQATAPIPEEEP